MTVNQIICAVYVLSWFVLLCIYIGSLFDKYRTSSKEPWYFYLLLIAGAPVWVLMVPYIAITSRKERKAMIKYRKEYKMKKSEKEKRCKSAKRDYMKATANNTRVEICDYMQVAWNLLDTVDKEQFRNIPLVLDKMTLPEGCSLRIKLCERNDFGDASKLYLRTTGGDRYFAVFEKLCFEDSCMGAWQAYLVHQLPHYLPLWWHANYDKRDYLYVKGDVLRIHHFTEAEPELSAFSDEELAPEVFKVGDKYYISACFWSEFGGLIREYVQVRLKDGLLDEFLVFDERVLFEYNCGIVF